MSDSQQDSFGKYVPGFDFLKSLATGATQSMPSMPGVNNWVAPTLNTEEIDKRISELKAVHFWLDQNTKALAATIQALEVQKLTLTALKGMNLNMSEIANAFKIPTAQAPKPAEPEPPVEKPAPAPEPASAEAPEAAAPAATGLLDTMQMWSALTQQFQHIAADAMKEAGKAAAQAPEAASAKESVPKTKAAKKPAAKKSVKKPVAKKATAPRSA